MRSLRFTSALLPALALIGACGSDPEPSTQTPPKITSNAVTTGKVGVAYSYSILASGNPIPSVAATKAPTWLTLSGRVLSGTPAAADEGVHEVTITASNGVEPNATQSFMVTVAPADGTETAPTITSTPMNAAVVGVEYAYVVTATGDPAPTITATGDGGAALPTWLTFNAETARLVGTPARANIGAHSIVITAANGIDPDARQTFTITVSATGTAPAFTSTPVTDAVQAVAYSYTVTVTGAPAPTVTATQIPAWLTFAGSVLSGTPAAGDLGDHDIVLTASNGVDPAATQSFTITVIDTGVAPAFTSTPVTAVDEGVAYSYTVAVTGTPAPTVTATQIPAWLTFAGDVLSGTPATADVGDHDIVLTASNGVNPDATQTFTITVASALGTAPSFTSTPITAAVEGELYTYTATATGDPAPTISATSLPNWLMFDAPTGILSGTPDAADVGTHMVELTAMNGVAPVAIQTFTVDVALAPVAPSITSTAVTSVIEGQAYGYTVTAVGVPTPTLAASVAGGAALPAWLSFDANTGLFSGTPAAGDVGTVDLVITAANGVAPDATQAFTLTVVAATTAPMITSTAPLAAQVGSLYTYQITATAVPTATITVTGLPGWLTFDGTDTLSGTPLEANIGTTADMTVTADNGVPPPATQVYAITVSPMPAIVLAGAPYIQNFDNGTAPGWAAGGQWAFGAATTGAAAVGPPSLFDGPLAATNLTGNYVVSANWTLRTPTFDFTGVTSPRLRFAHWYNFERSAAGTSNYDGGNIKISTDGGTTWAQIDPASVVPPYVGALVAGNTMPAQQAWSGILTDWQLVNIDLTTALTGAPLDQVVLRFDFGSDSSVVRPGWYVDAVRVGAAADFAVPPAITSALPNISVVAGTPWSYTVTTTGMPQPTVTAAGAAGAALPSWLTFNPTTGVLSGTPANADAGANAVVLTASNGEPRNAVQAFTITVVPIQTLVGYVFDGDVRTATTVAANVTAGAIDNRLSTTTFVAGNPGRALNSNGFIDAGDPNYYQFTVTPAVGMQLELVGFTFDHYRSGTGPTNFQVSVVSGGVVTPLVAGAGTIPNATTWTPATIGVTPANAGPYTGPVSIRIAAWGASSAAGTFRIDNVALNGLVRARAPAAPTITGTPGTTAMIGVPYSYAFVVDGWTAPTVTVTGLPAWLTYTAATRTIAGTPSGLNVGTSAPITITAANGVTPNAVQTFTITIAAPPSVPVVNGSPVIQGFGTTLPTGWSASGGWAFGIPTTGAATVGPPSVLDGACAATVLNGNYATSALWSLATQTYDLTGVTNPILQFTHWYNFERTGTTNYDGANVKISTNGGATWTQLLPTSVSPAYVGNLVAGNTMPGQAAWSGILTNWELVTIDLSANLVGAPLGQVVIRLDLGSDSSVVRPGWYVDNLRIGAAADLAVAPVITSLADRSAREALAFSHVVAATGVPAPTFTATGPGGAALPAWLTFNAGTRTLSGTPLTANVGTTAVTITATNVGGASTQTLNIRVFAAGAVPVFSDNFDGVAAGWLIGFNAGTGTDWQIGTPTVVGPTACNSGTMCAGTQLAANYTVENRLSYLQTPVLDLTGLPEPRFRFRQWYRTESTFDGGNVKISTDGGATFSPITATSVTPVYTGVLSSSFGNPLGGQMAWNGTGTTWTQVAINLAPDLVSLPRNQVVLRFEFGSDDDTSFPGWYVDDVLIGDVVTLP